MTKRQKQNRKGDRENKIIARIEKRRERDKRCLDCGHAKHGIGYGCNAWNCYCGELDR